MNAICFYMCWKEPIGPTQGDGCRNIFGSNHHLLRLPFNRNIKNHRHIATQKFTFQKPPLFGWTVFKTLVGWWYRRWYYPIYWGLSSMVGTPTDHPVFNVMTFQVNLNNNPLCWWYSHDVSASFLGFEHCHFLPIDNENWSTVTSSIFLPSPQSPA